MLLRFRVANVRSLREEQELSFVVPPGEDASGTREVMLADGPLRVFPLIGIFGANASGKSNVLTSMARMREAVLNSYAKWASYEGTPREVFALDPKSADEPSFFEVDVAIDGVRWTYGFELGPERVESEWVHSYPHGRRQEWLDRDASRTELYRWPGSRVKDRAQLARRTRPNALLLSTAGTDNHPQLSPLFHWFRRNLWEIGPETERKQREAFTAQQLTGKRGERIRELLRVADLGITGAEIQQPDGGASVRLTHRAEDGEVPFDWALESFGTRSWFALLGTMLLALEDHDNHPGVDTALARAESYNLSVAFSHPCFEIWRVLHLKEASGSFGGVCRVAEQRLPAAWHKVPGGIKALLPDQVKKQYEVARGRAVKMNAEHPDHVPRHKRDPYTDVYKFVEEGLGIASY
ncbi:AAA family ATPase [Streptomyces varsoviensis]|uniref:AAA family ATPase n=1 Tax=Streptomyces varsoviensis TaxID=67373 RepID=UPI000998B27E|nr:AAA family ATPase [Streptomyces varsoviensis]